MISQRRLKELLTYYPDTGIFTWNLSRGNQFSPVGGEAGFTTEKGYIRIELEGKSYLLHRLAFLYMEGAFPIDQVDHINRIRNDNRWENLRPADVYLNAGNQKSNGEFVGVSWDSSRGKWLSRMQVNQACPSRKRFITHLAACYHRHCLEVTHG